MSRIPPISEAETLALTALADIVADPDLRDRLLALTGMAPEDLRARAGERETLIGVLEFLLGHEPDLTGFCDRHGLPYDLVARARHRLLFPDGGRHEESI